MDTLRCISSRRDGFMRYFSGLVFAKCTRTGTNPVCQTGVDQNSPLWIPVERKSVPAFLCRHRAPWHSFSYGAPASSHDDCVRTSTSLTTPPSSDHDRRDSMAHGLAILLAFQVAAAGGERCAQRSRVEHRARRAQAALPPEQGEPPRLGGAAGVSRRNHRHATRVRCRGWGGQQASDRKVRVATAAHIGASRDLATLPMPARVAQWRSPRPAFGRLLARGRLLPPEQ